MDAIAEAFPAFLYRAPAAADNDSFADVAPPSRWRRLMDNLVTLRREVHGLFRRGRVMVNNVRASGLASAQSQTQQQVDPALQAVFRAIDQMRALDGERAVNHLLRNLMQQSNKRLADLGVPTADENADLRMEVLKHESEARRAKQYANHFGSKLREISDLSKDDGILDAQAIADGALTWDPDFHQSVADLGEQMARAAH
jgi:hypothetical protein